MGEQSRPFKNQDAKGTALSENNNRDKIFKSALRWNAEISMAKYIFKHSWLLNFHDRKIIISINKWVFIDCWYEENQF